MSSAQTDPIIEGFDLSHGLELVEVGVERARARMVVRDELKQSLGAVHGGVYAMIAESLTGLATARALAPHRKTAAPMSSQMSFARPITEGAIHALAVARHRGRTTWVWEVEFLDDQGRLCVLTRMTLAVSDLAGG